MDLILEASDLKPALNKLRHAVARNSQTIILNHFSLRTLDAETLQLSATDQSVEMIVNIPARILVDGHWALQADQLQKVLSAAPDGSQVELALNPDNHRIKIRHGKSKFELPCLPGADMPHLMVSGKSWSLTMAGAELQELFSVSEFAAGSRDDHRAYLQGVSLIGNIDGENGCTLRGYASNGHWMGRVISDIPAPADWRNLIVPTKACGQISDLVKDAAEVTVMGMERLLLIECGAYTYITKLVQGNSIDFERAMPSDIEATIQVNRKDFQANVKALTALANDDAHAIRISPKDGLLALSLSERAEAKGYVEINAQTPDLGYQIGVNGTYASGICGQFDQTELEIGLINPNSVMRFTARDSRLTAAVMPVRIKDDEQ